MSNPSLINSPALDSWITLDTDGTVHVRSGKVDIGDVSYGDADGIAMLEIPYTCVPDSAANAEFDLVYT